MNPVARTPDFTEYKQRMHRLIQQNAKTEDSNANKSLGFVRRNLSECASQMKSVAYTTFVPPRVLLYSVGS